VYLGIAHWSRHLAIEHPADDVDARKLLEALRWPHGPRCPHCDSCSSVRRRGVSHRPGLIFCRQCRGTYTVTVGTSLHRTRVRLSSWLLLVELLCASQGRMGIVDLSDKLGVNYRTVRAMARIVELAIDDYSSASSVTVHTRLLTEQQHRTGRRLKSSRWFRQK
jgi:transposase-like protein